MSVFCPIQIIFDQNDIVKFKGSNILKMSIAESVLRVAFVGFVYLWSKLSSEFPDSKSGAVVFSSNNNLTWIASK